MDGCRATTFYGLLEAVELRDHSHIPGGCSTELYAEANDLRLHEVYARCIRSIALLNELFYCELIS